MALSTPKELFGAVVEWDNKHNNGELQKSKFNILASQAKGGAHHGTHPVDIPEEEWRTLEEHLKTEYFSNWSENGDDDEDEEYMLDSLLDRLFDHVKRA